MKLYNVLNTTGDKPACSASWLEALEHQLGRKLEKYVNGEEMVGGHMSSCSGRYGPQNTEYIAYIPKSFNENQNNYTYIEVKQGDFAPYKDVRFK